MSAHIPDPHEKTTLFYGWYSNRTRGYRKQHGLLANAEAPDPVPGTDHRAPLEVRRSWARLIRQVYEVDPLLCPQCGGTMKVIAVIERPAIIRQILEHLGLSTAAPSLRAPPDPPREWSYELLFDDLPIPDPACLPAGRCSYSRGRCAGLSRLIFPCLKTRKIPLDPPLRW